MPRKAANNTAESGESAVEPRRSSRIKEQPKEETAPKKAPAKPRAKKADKEATDKEEKPKSSRGKKRKAEEEPNGAEDDAEAPAEKKVRFSFLIVAELAFLRHFDVYFNRLSLRQKPRLPLPSQRPKLLLNLPQKLL